MDLSTSSVPQKIHVLLPSRTQIKDPKAWNPIIRNHVRLRNDQAVLTCYTQMEASGVFPDVFVIPLVLKACTRLKAIEKGRKIHSDIQAMGLTEDVRIQTALVDFYCKCGFLEEAVHLFEETPNRDTVFWNAMICGYVGNSRYKDAVLMFARMQGENLRPSSVTLVGLLSACGELLELRLGQEIHCHCLRNGLFDSESHVGTALIGFYSRFNVRVSRLVFDLMVVRNIVSWNAMISGYVNMEDSSEAQRLFKWMPIDEISLNSVTVLVTVQSCTSNGFAEFGKQIHQIAIKNGFSSDIFIVNALLVMYGKNGSLESSHKLFETIPTTKRDVALWNAMLSAFKECGSSDEAFRAFDRMRSEGIRENETTIAILLSICNDSANGLEGGKSLHAHVIKSGMDMDAALGNAVMGMYIDLECVHSAQKVFNEMSSTNVLSWNTIILALAHNKLTGLVWYLFGQMRESCIKPNSFTMIAVLAACQDKAYLNVGRSIHGYVIRHGFEVHTSLSTALTQMYISCGDEARGRQLFDDFPNKDLISWNALISSYIQNNQPNKAVLLFQQMILEVEPDPVTIVNVLTSCTHLANLPQGRSLHAFIIRKAFDLVFDISVGNSLVTLYARCGVMSNAEMVFRSLPRTDVISWNAMIAGYGVHGHGEEALLAFSRMLEYGLRPTSVTFVSVLSACSHSGLIEEGWQHFRSMAEDYDVVPDVVHYACMVDLLGRGGRLGEAKNFIDSMPIQPDASVWRALLGACRVYSDIELAKTIFQKLVELEPMNAGNYILLSNIYAAAGLWVEVRKLRTQLKEKGLGKPPGNSWIVMRNQVHCFTAGDRSHPQSDKIYMKLSHLADSISAIGYVPDQRWVLHDLEDDEKEIKLLGHSEKLAISFGLLNTSGGRTILITKNLRICGDCHTFSKFVSKFVGRKIILRDASRFHHFSDGVCSCKDYW
ncbi:pentatricopeptide repeat-containing protein ELI1, chloroplastic-like [Macadamia integrifolia]|uniref:pentatricopeptide repeat-containing protein ELI1, chloroplastic-like n=1 Tax=Macadamia integrifolia TaxID=60698 RepID=UPI001C4EA91A|nr:pentatricopeptide repeat-containing protein ELI1, chloroplastic-like [Macadamia integrifolia]